MFKLLCDLRGMKKDRKEKFEMLENCILMHNVLVDDYENKKYELGKVSINNIENNFKIVIDYMESYIDTVQESINQIDDPEVEVYFSSLILRDKMEALNDDYKEILKEIKSLYKIVNPIINEYREKILK